jgi:hypothetical protein
VKVKTVFPKTPQSDDSGKDRAMEVDSIAGEGIIGRSACTPSRQRESRRASGFRAYLPLESEHKFPGSKLI